MNATQGSHSGQWLPASNCSHYNEWDEVDALNPWESEDWCTGPDFEISTNIGDYMLGAGLITAVYEVYSVDEGPYVVAGWTTTSTTTTAPIGCFPADSLVWTESRGQIAISGLQTGDKILSPELKPDVMAGWTHYMTDVHLSEADAAYVEVEYIEIYHELMQPGQPLRISGDHLLFLSDGTAGPWQLRPAEDVKVGNYVLAHPSSTLNMTTSEHNMRTSGHAHSVLKSSSVTKLAKVNAQGRYSPLTTSNRLLVEGVAVSATALTSETQRRALPLGTVGSIEFFVGLALFPNKIWYWAGLPFSWLHGPKSEKSWRERSHLKAFEKFVDSLLEAAVSLNHYVDMNYILSMR